MIHALHRSLLHALDGDTAHLSRANACTCVLGISAPIRRNHLMGQLTPVAPVIALLTSVVGGDAGIGEPSSVRVGNAWCTFNSPACIHRGDSIEHPYRTRDTNAQERQRNASAPSERANGARSIALCRSNFKVSAFEQRLQRDIVCGRLGSDRNRPRKGPANTTNASSRYITQRIESPCTSTPQRHQPHGFCGIILR